VHKVYPIVVEVCAEESRRILDGMYFLARRPTAKASVLPVALTVMAKLVGKLTDHGIGDATGSSVDIIYGNDNEAASARFIGSQYLGDLFSSKILACFQKG
jgi:hypothetical protein